MIRCLVLWGLVAAQLSGDDLHQFHELTIEILQHPCGFKTTLAPDMHLGEQALCNVYLRNCSCVSQAAELCHFLTLINRVRLWPQLWFVNLSMKHSGVGGDEVVRKERPRITFHVLANQKGTSKCEKWKKVEFWHHNTVNISAFEPVCEEKILPQCGLLLKTAAYCTLCKW